MTLKKNLNKDAEALKKKSADNNTRDRKFDELIKSINTGLHEEKFVGLETRISAMEKGTTEAGCRRLDNAQGKSKYLRLWNLTKDSTGKDWATSSMQ